MQVFCEASPQVQSISGMCKARNMMYGGDTLHGFDAPPVHILQVVICRQENRWQDGPAVRPGSLVPSSTDIGRLAGCADTWPLMWSAILQAFFLAEAGQGPVHPPPLPRRNVHTG